jgi:hypothetical protein
MKKTICFKVNKPYRNNILFTKGGDLDFYYQVKIKLEQNNFKVGTQDLIDEKKSNYVISLDYRKDYKKNHGKNILIALESIAAITETFKPSYLNKFDYVFTWNEDFHDNMKIFPLNYSYVLKFKKFIDFKDKQKLICNFSSNKLSNHKDELYSERIKAIEYFNLNHPQEFDLFGYGWKKSFKYPNYYSLFQKMNQTKFLRGIKKLIEYSRVFDSMIYTKYTVYKGLVPFEPVDSKINILQNYKFSICYENVLNVNGYITEKIFDCFKAGVVPIYLGPDNIKDIIPSNTFIDKREFESYQELYNFIINMSPRKYKEYITNIENYLSSSDINKYKSENTADSFVKKILSL